MLNRRPYHLNDIRLFLILIPLIAAINYHLTYVNIQLNWRLVITYLIDVQQGYVALFCVRAIILYLDRVYPYRRNAARRILMQAAATTIIGDAVIIIQTLIMHQLFSDKPFPFSFFTMDMVIISIWFLVVNGIYIGLHYYTEWQNAEEQRKNELLLRSEGYVVKYGKKNLAVPFVEIIGFTIEKDYAVLVTSGLKNYYLDESLDAVEKKLPAELFFRLNRQFIVHRQMVTGFDRAENGKINVLLSSADSFPAFISVSRLKAPAFKAWFQTG
jgi:DNA-binding LytR/AlgR family response regulator